MRGLMKLSVRVLAVLTLALLTFPAHAAAGGTLVAYSVITNTDVSSIWRKAQGPLKKGFNFVTPEFKWVRDFKEIDIDPSLREMTFPIDLFEDRGITSLPEGGREAEPMTQNAVDATLQFIHVNGRFTVAKRARWALQSDGGRAALENQLKFSGRKKIEALGRVIGDMFYGYSTNYICQTSTDATQASGTYTLTNMYGDSTYASGTSVFGTAVKKRIVDQIKVGDVVGLIRSAALVANGIGTVTAKSAANGTVTITWAGSVDSDANDYLVFANGAGATTINHTSYNRGLVGRLDMQKSTSVHSVSSGTYPDWSAAYSDTTAGRFTGEKWRKGVDEIHNYGDGEAQIVTLMDQGVYRDVLAQYKAGVRFDDTFSLEIDGDLKGKGRRFKSSRRIPPGMVDMFAEGAIMRKSLHENPSSAPSWGDGKELIDDSGWIFAVEESLFICTDSRKKQAYFESQTQI